MDILDTIIAYKTVKGGVGGVNALSKGFNRLIGVITARPTAVAIAGITALAIGILALNDEMQHQNIASYFGAISISLDEAITFDVFVDAEETSECYVISGSAFAEVSARDPKIKIFALETAVSRFSDVMWVMQQILFMSMDKRLAIFLTDEIARTKSDTVTLTHEQIARYMGSAREVVSRMLKYFAAEGIVEVFRGGIRILDKERLRRLAL